MRRLAAIAASMAIGLIVGVGAINVSAFAGITINSHSLDPKTYTTSVGQPVVWFNATTTVQVVSITGTGISLTVDPGAVSSAWVPTAGGTYQYTVVSQQPPKVQSGSVVVSGPSPTPKPTATPTPKPTATPRPSPSPTPGASASPSPGSSSSPTSSPSPSDTASPAPTAGASGPTGSPGVEPGASGSGGSVSGALVILLLLVLAAGLVLILYGAASRRSPPPAS